MDSQKNDYKGMDGGMDRSTGPHLQGIYNNIYFSRSAILLIDVGNRLSFSCYPYAPKILQWYIYICILIKLNWALRKMNKMLSTLFDQNF